MPADRSDPLARPDRATNPDDASSTDHEFWGGQATWDEAASSTARPPRPRLGATVGRWWGTLLGNDATAERIHGDPSTGRGHCDDVRSGVEHDDYDDNHVDHDLDADHGDGGDAEWEVTPTPRRTLPIDPLIARLGGLIVVVTVSVPVILGFAPDSAPSTIGSELPVAAEVAVTPLAASAAPAVEPSASSTETTNATSTSTVSAPLADPVESPMTAAPVPPEPTAAATAQLVVPDPATTTPAATAPPSTAPPCGAQYELAAGDYWIRIADAADITLGELLDVNGASVETVLVPGGSICLPLGASTPTPPPAPTTTAPQKAAATPRATAGTNTTTAGSTTPRPAATTTTTTAPPRPAAVSAEQAVAIIREIWPDELEERAIEIAWRESNHRSNVNNSCCYGLFQIHWPAHRDWLGSLGATSATQLYDPALNARAALVLYQRAGGFGPWGG